MLYYMRFISYCMVGIIFNIQFKIIILFISEFLLVNFIYIIQNMNIEYFFKSLDDSVKFGKNG
ncbi:hypothetical protein pb186bvf_012810 [Paramecium bursaria]